MSRRLEGVAFLTAHVVSPFDTPLMGYDGRSSLHSHVSPWKLREQHDFMIRFKAACLLPQPLHGKFDLDP
jgi:hypothetical protein